MFEEIKTIELPLDLKAMREDVKDHTEFSGSCSMIINDRAYLVEFDDIQPEVEGRVRFKVVKKLS